MDTTVPWILVALGRRPRTLPELLDDVRGLDGRVGHGTFLAAITRLEREGRITSDPAPASERPVYRTTERRMETPS